MPFGRPLVLEALKSLPIPDMGFFLIPGVYRSGFKEPQRVHPSTSSPQLAGFLKGGVALKIFPSDS